MKKFYTNIFLLFIFSVLIISCREEVISPDNPAGNINEPVTSNSVNSYSFVINAENISYEVINHTFLNSRSSAVYFSVADHGSGNVLFVVRDDNSSVLYATSLSRDIKGATARIEGSVPNIVELDFNNFTGKLKIQISRSD